MSLTLHLGVLPIPYAEKDGVDTYDVAVWLENKYGVMQSFFDANQQKIGDLIAEDVANAIDTMMAGDSPQQDLFTDATDEIQRMFQFDWIGQAQVEKAGIDGVPTKAALKGVSHRFKNKKGARRVSFYDTGEYEGSFRAWIDPE